MEERDRQILIELKRRIPDDLQPHIRKLIVYGSRARGEASEDSDLDVAIVVDRKGTKIEKRLDDIAYRVMWDYDFKPIISLKVFGQGQFQNALRKGFSFYRHVVQEGIAL